MKRRITIAAALLLAATAAGCTSARFVPTAPQQAAPLQVPSAPKASTGGPYTREREDREFGQRPQEE
jgi:hypothetical protein